MTVYLVGAGPGDPGLITVKGAELLARADVVLYDRLVDRALLGLVPSSATLIDVGKVAEPGSQGTAARQESINAQLVEHARSGATVVRLKGGDPFLFGRGGEEAQALSEAGVDWAVVPGVTSALGAPSAAGLPVTHRGISSAVVVVPGQVGGGSASPGVDWDMLAGLRATIVVLMGAAERAAIAARLISAGRPPAEPVAVVERATTTSERVRRTTLERLGALDVESPAVIVIGDVSALDLGAPVKGRLAGTTVVVTRPRAQASSLSLALRACGARVLELPTIELGDPDDAGEALRSAAGRVDRYDWVVFTSQNAVERFVAELDDLRKLASVKLAAVGWATASSLARHKLIADLVPERPDTEGLVRAFPDAKGARVLFVRASRVAGSLAEGLEKKGYGVDEVVGYETRRAPPPLAQIADELAEADVIIFASPSAVSAFLSLRDSAGRPLALPPLVACIGATTSAAARDAGLTVALECPTASAQALTSAIAQSLGR
ncbi:MAG: uroporphyrinogen-III C-methyltransferase [Acidimicrobiales bacterium]